MSCLEIYVSEHFEALLIIYRFCYNNYDHCGLLAKVKFKADLIAFLAIILPLSALFFRLVRVFILFALKTAVPYISNFVF